MGQTWADASEVFVARRFGWAVEPMESVVFNETMNHAHKRFDADAGRATDAAIAVSSTRRRAPVAFTGAAAATRGGTRTPDRWRSS